MRAKRTFKIASLFEGVKYVGVFDNATGEAMYHLINGELVRSGGTAPQPEIFESEIKVNKKQTTIF